MPDAGKGSVLRGSNAERSAIIQVPFIVANRPGHAGEDGSLRQHYLEQVQRVCRAPARHSQPSRRHTPALVGSPVTSSRLSPPRVRVKTSRAVILAGWTESGARLLATLGRTGGLQIEIDAWPCAEGRTFLSRQLTHCNLQSSVREPARKAPNELLAKSSPLTLPLPARYKMINLAPHECPLKPHRCEPDPAPAQAI